LTGTTNVHHSDTKRRGLYHWARRQRLAYKKKELTKDRIKRLEKIGFQWDTPKPKADSSDDESNSSSDDTAQEKSKFSKAKSKSKLTATSRVGSRKARSKKTTGDSSDESMSSGGLDKFQRRWLQSFRELKQFQREHGTLIGMIVEHLLKLPLKL
jgi:Helicase associated domain